ncbi:MAG: phosphoribosyltransferase family protein [Actinomycetota bacterium]
MTDASMTARGPHAFRDREEAGEMLAAALTGRFEPGRVVILAIPRGGVVVAVPVARALGGPLDVVIPHKLGAPGNSELAIGAIAPGVRVLDDRLIRALAVPSSYLQQEVEAQEAEIERRTRLYREDRVAPPLEGATAVVVDDGVATGATAIAALRWSRGEGAARVVFAAPVGPVAIVRQLARECDDVVLVETPRTFSSVGEWYRRFDQVTDEEVLAALRGNA